jgi:hypothetical protein
MSKCIEFFGAVPKDSVMGDTFTLHKYIREIQAENERLKKALEYYAQPWADKRQELCAFKAREALSQTRTVEIEVDDE